MLRALALSLALLLPAGALSQGAPVPPAVAAFAAAYVKLLEKKGIADKCEFAVVARRGESIVMRVDCAKAPNVCYVGILDENDTSPDADMELLGCEPRPIKS